MSDEAALQKEADEAFRSSVGTRFASADERTAVVTLCARSSVQCGLRPAALVRRWEAHTLNARVAGPVTLKAFAAFVQTLRHQTASTLAATTPGTAPARASPYAPSENKSPLVAGVEDEEDERKSKARAPQHFGETPRVVKVLLGDTDGDANGAAPMDVEGADAAAAPVELTLETVVPEYRYMDESPYDAARAREDACEAAVAELREAPAVVAAIAAAVAAGGGRTTRLTAPVQETTIVFGTVVPDERAGAGAKFDAGSCFLRAPLSEGGETVPLDLRNCAECGLFPGMVVAAEGTNPTGKCFITRVIHTLDPHPARPLGPGAPGRTRPYEIVVAAGPFAPRGTLDYAAFAQLVRQTARRAPDVLVLAGPFVDAADAAVQRARRSHEALFAACVANWLVLLNRTRCRVLAVPAPDDAAAPACVLPQPPLPRTLFPAAVADRVVRAPNPCVAALDGGLALGVGAADAAGCLSRAFVHRGTPSGGSAGGADRLGALCRALVAARTFYPAACAADAAAPVHTAQRAHLALAPHTPDVLVLPSDLAAFAHRVALPGGRTCTCVNPGRLALGTYARITADPATRTVTHVALMQL